MPYLRAGVIGHPIGHSKSPIIHNHWMAAHGLKGLYEAIDAPPEKLHETIRHLIEGGYAGFNVTIPHKQAVMALCDDVDRKARAIGAVNTVKIENGRLYGHNTDCDGFIASLKQTLPSFDFSAGPAVVLGAGGAARAVVYGLLSAGVTHIRLCNRTFATAQEFAQSFPGVTPVPWDSRNDALLGAHLVVNTTSLGMKGQEALEIDVSTLPRAAAVCDIVYVPLMTGLLSAAKMRGNPTVTGIGMLLHQAAAAFEIWFGVRPDVDAALEEKVLQS